LGNAGLVKLDLYREKIHVYPPLDAEDPLITVDARNGPIQRVDLTGLDDVNGTSAVQFRLESSTWNTGQGVTVIINHNVNNGSLLSAANWSNQVTNAQYSSTPQILPNRQTLVYVVGYHESDAPATSPTTYYITSQTFGTI